jgi:hypothetical protein
MIFSLFFCLSSRLAHTCPSHPFSTAFFLNAFFRSLLQVRPASDGFIGTLGIYFSTSYVLTCLEWCNANMSLPRDTRQSNQDVIPQQTMVGIGGDMLLSKYNKETPEAHAYGTKMHLVQHVGIESARRIVAHHVQNRFPRTQSFPYVEGYVVLDDDEWW